jgi:RNA polymerase sigma-70 factor (ECF subfamily)
VCFIYQFNKRIYKIIEANFSMKEANLYSDEQIIRLLEQNDSSAIEMLFHKYYDEMCVSVVRMIRDPEQAEDLVQEVFYTLWKNRGKLQINTSIRAYLKRSTVNRTLNFIRDNKKKTASSLDQSLEKDWKNSDYDSFQQLQFEELEGKIEQCIQSLPPRCRIVFVLSRNEQLSHKEIAAKLEISEKTVENQIGKALKVLREELKDYLKR